MAGRRGVMISDGHQIADLPRGTECVRWVLKPDVDRTQFAQTLVSLDIAPAPVLTSESFPGWNESWTADRFTQQLQLYEARYGDFVRAGGRGWIEVGNEPDGVDAPSWVMPEASWIELASACRAAYPAPANTLVLGGLVSGRIGWLEGVKALLAPTGSRLADLVDGLGVHPYGKWPFNWNPPPQGWVNFGPLSGLFELYRNYNLPLYLTEAGAQDREVGRDFQGTYLATLFTEAIPKCAAVIWYQLQDYANPHEGGDVTFGLRTILGGPKPALTAFEALATPVPAPPAVAPVHTIEEFEARHAAKLGRRWEPGVGATGGGDVRTLASVGDKAVVRVAGYERHVVLEIDGDLYPLQVDTSFFAP